MAGFGVKMSVYGVKEITEAFEQYGARGETNMRKAQMATAQKIRTDTIRSIQGHGSRGHTYLKFDPKRIHTASTPGSPPNTDTGTLVSRIIVKKADKNVVMVGSALPYFRWLEDGTQDMQARPSLIPALKMNEQFYIDSLTAGLRLAAHGLPLEFKR